MASFRSGGNKPYSRPTKGNAEGRWLHDKFPGAPGRKASRLDNGAPTDLPAGITTKLEISNLHYEVTPKDLSAIFGQIGTLVREPLLRYDDSGRSTGTAIVTFETEAEATRARNQFDGILAKGQPMSVKFYTRVPRPRRAASAPSTLSLLNRIEKPPLSERLSIDDASVDRKTPASRGKGKVGPIRRKDVRNERRPRAKKPKTAEELDKELDAFMGDAESTPTSVQEAPAPATEAASAAEVVTQDVEMV